MKTPYIALIVTSIAASSALSYVAGQNAGRGEGRLEMQPEIQRLHENWQLEKQQAAGLLDSNRIEKDAFDRLNSKRLEGIGKTREIADTLKSAPPGERDELLDTLLSSLGSSFSEFPGDVELWTEYVRLDVGEQDWQLELTEARNQIREFEARVEAERRSGTEGLPAGMLRVKPVALTE